jgi:hypothetical protein
MLAFECVLWDSFVFARCLFICLKLQLCQLLLVFVSTCVSSVKATILALSVQKRIVLTLFE